MHVITRRPLQQFGQKHPDAARPLAQWYQAARHARWQSLQDVRAIFPHADAVAVGSGRTVTVFNIAGNKYRLITAIHYNTQRVYVLMVLTHREYGKDAWKDRL